MEQLVRIYVADYAISSSAARMFENEVDRLAGDGWLVVTIASTRDGEFVAVYQRAAPRRNP